MEKLAQDLPGAFSKQEPYAMQRRIQKTLGSPPGGKPKARTQIGTTGTSTGTVQGPVPAGMGRMKKADLDEIFGKAKKMVKQNQVANPVTTQKNLLGGGKPVVGPQMRTTAKPVTMNVKIAAFPTKEDCMLALTPAPTPDQVLMSKEGSQARLVKTFETLNRLETTTDLNEKLACIVELAGLRKEAFWSGVLRS